MLRHLAFVRISIQQKFHQGRGERPHGWFLCHVEAGRYFHKGPDEVRRECRRLLLLLKGHAAKISLLILRA